MDIYLYHNDKVAGPYREEQVATMLLNGTVSRGELAWRADGKDWQPVETIVAVPAPLPKPTFQAQPTMAGYRKGLLVGAATTGTLLAVAALYFLMQSPPPGETIALPQPDAEQVIVEAEALPQPAEAPDIAAETVAVDAAADNHDADLARLEQLREVAKAHQEAQDGLVQFQVIKAKYVMESDELGLERPVIEITVRNDTAHPVGAAHFRGVLTSEGRVAPWIDADFSHQIAGRLLPGEEATWRVQPDMWGPWAVMGVPEDAAMAVTVVKLQGAEGEFGAPVFTASDRDELRMLEATYGGGESAEIRRR